MGDKVLQQPFLMSENDVKENVSTLHTVSQLLKRLAAVEASACVVEGHTTLEEFQMALYNQSF